MKYSSTGNAVYSLTYHLVLVTKYRKKILNKNMIEDMREIVESILGRNECKLIEINGEEDYTHILMELVPRVSLVKIINSIKTVSSRILRNRYKLESIKMGKKVLWSSSYLIVTCGDFKFETLIKYVENQGNKFTPPKQSLKGA
jgi:putative transposase